MRPVAEVSLHVKLRTNKRKHMKKLNDFFAIYENASNEEAVSKPREKFSDITDKM
jgi:ferritin